MQMELTDALKARNKPVPARIKLVDFYHAQRSPEEREGAQQAWMLGNTRILAATVAFGMGIDKADVRWVFHHSLPKSLEGAALCASFLVPGSIAPRRPHGVQRLLSG